MPILNFNENDIKLMLDMFYNLALFGVKNSVPSVEMMSQQYLEKYHGNELAAKKMVDDQIFSSAASGVLTGMGGIPFLPVMIPANIGATLYFQIRMAASCAYIAGYDIDSEEVKIMILALLTDVPTSNIRTDLPKAHEDITESLNKKVPKNALEMTMNQVICKFLQMGLRNTAENVARFVPFVGAFINGGFNLFDTKKIADKCMKEFFPNKANAIEVI